MAIVSFNTAIWILVFLGPSLYGKIGVYWSSRTRLAAREDRQSVEKYGTLGSTLAATPVLSTYACVFAAGCLLKATFLTPSSLFQKLDKDIRVSSAELRAALEMKLLHSSSFSGTPLLPEKWERLLQRLTSFETRLLYAHFGEKPVQYCDWCRHFGQEGVADYLYYVLPSIASNYAMMCITLGLVSNSPDRRHWRTWGILTLVLGFCIEIYVLVSVDPRLNAVVGTTTQFISSQLAFYRHITFAALTLLPLLFPSLETAMLSDPSVDPILRVQTLHQRSQATLARLRFLALHRLATLSSRSLRGRKSEFEMRFGEKSEREAIEWAVAREKDEDVKEMIRVDQRLREEIERITEESSQFVTAMLGPLSDSNDEGEDQDEKGTDEGKEGKSSVEQIHP